MTLPQIIEDCKENKPEAQAMIYELFAPKLMAICFKYSKNKQEAEDNLHDGFLIIFKKIDQFKHKGSFEGWMKRIVINCTLQKYRKKNVLQLTQEEAQEEIFVEVEESALNIDDLLYMIQQLPNRYRLVFNLYVLDGYTHKQIGNMLNISDGTSKSNLSRAKLILKNKLENKELKNQNTF
ncbi:sigma-70 family RNA polymerase sigma factor [Flavicella sp.]|uniref:RNA polymerase sigma factor n=1 Tax=Flavicella sp. TaxID=2957742 RepID=UPI0030168EA0